MKSTLLFFLTLFFCMTTSFGQVFELVGYPDTVFYNPATASITLKGKFNNHDTLARDLKAERTLNDLAPGHKTNFCWGPTCYGPNDNKSLGTWNIAAGYSDTTYKLTFEPNSQTGITTVAMYFYDNENTADFVRDTIVFINDPSAAISGEDKALGFSLSNPYPAPAQAFAYVNYELPSGITAQLRLSELHGRDLHTQPLNAFAGKARIETGDLTAGIYLISLVTDNRIVGSVKLIVK